MGTLSHRDSMITHLNHATEYNFIFSDGPGPSEHQNNANSRPPEVACDYFGGVYEYIKQMLMDEDDLDHRPCMFQDCSALQAAEKYFNDALSGKNSAAPPPSIRPPSIYDSASGFNSWSLLGPDIYGESGPSFSCDFDRLVGSPPSHFQALISIPNHEISRSTSLMDNNGASSFQFSINELDLEQRISQLGEERTDVQSAPLSSREKKSHERENNGDCTEERNRKQQSTNGEESSVQMEKYDKSLLCPKMNPGFYADSPPAADSEGTSDSEEENKRNYRKTREVKRGRPKGSKKNRKVNEVVDLRSLLTRCAETVSNFDIKTGEDLLKQIRSHSSPYGDANERLAHCFANALEARMAGTGSALYSAVASRRIPASELLKSYQAYVTVCPFKRMSNIFANKSIAKFTKEATRIHIIDFGIFYGFQWPCIIQGLSLKPGGPPRLKITGIDYPQPGFKPAERVEQTGKRLMEYCKRFNVPFEYNAIAKKWEDIQVEDLNMERDEMVIVNCLYRLRHVPDESAGVNSPRDSVLSLIKKVNPCLFVHGVINGTYNASFFATRFKEALYHYSSLFDMLEATLPREDEDRLLYEREVFGRDVMNVIACEGAERVERPESYKQWQVRNQRAGFRRVGLYKEIAEEVKVKVRTDYHKDFMVEEDGGWLLQGWKGRVMYALSCWTGMI